MDASRRHALLELARRAPTPPPTSARPLGRHVVFDSAPVLTPSANNVCRTVSAAAIATSRSPGSCSSTVAPCLVRLSGGPVADATPPAGYAERLEAELEASRGAESALPIAGRLHAIERADLAPAALGSVAARWVEDLDDHIDELLEAAFELADALATDPVIASRFRAPLSRTVRVRQGIRPRRRPGRTPRSLGAVLDQGRPARRRRYSWSRWRNGAGSRATATARSKASSASSSRPSSCRRIARPTWASAKVGRRRTTSS